jgi:hypothetical protein
MVGRFFAIPTIEQQPSLYQNVVGSDLVSRTLEDGFGARIVAIPCDRGCKPDGSINENAQ